MFNIQILNKIKSKKLFKLLGIISISMLLYLFYLHLMYGYHPDCSSIILRAKDILNGNIFLKDWYGTTTNGIFSFTLYGIIGIFLAGFNNIACHASWSVMYVILLLLVFILIHKYRKQSKFIYLIVACCFFTTFHCKSSLYQFFWGSHVEIMTYIIGALILIQSIINKKYENNNLLILFAILMFIIGFSDAFAFALLFFPLIIVMIIRFLINKDKLCLNLSIISFVTLVISKILSRLLSLNGIWQYSNSGEKYFCSIKTLLYNIVYTITAYANTFNANISGENINGLGFFCKLIGIALLFISLFIFLYDFKNFFKQDAITQILLVAIVTQTAGFILLEFYCGHEQRYIMPCCIYLLILVGIFDWNKFLLCLSNRLKSININCKIRHIKIIFLCFFLMVPISQIKYLTFSTDLFNVPSDTFLYSKELVDFLMAKGCKKGYARFDISNLTTVGSSGKIILNDIVVNNGLHRNKWFSKHDKIAGPVNFVVWDVERVQEIEDWLGEPKEIHNIDNYSILIYDYDISKKVNSDYNVFNFGSQLGYNSEISNCIDKKLMLNPNDVQFGPYAHLNKGKYTVTILGDNLDNGTFDIYSGKSNKILKLENLKVTPTKVTYDVKLDKNVNDIEFRCHNNSSDAIVIKSLNATYKK